MNVGRIGRPLENRNNVSQSHNGLEVIDDGPEIVPLNFSLLNKKAHSSKPKHRTDSKKHKILNQKDAPKKETNNSQQQNNNVNKNVQNKKNRILLKKEAILIHIILFKNNPPQSLSIFLQVSDRQNNIHTNCM